MVNLEKLIDPNVLNVAEAMEEEQLSKVGAELKKAFDVDLLSRKSWEDNVDEWMKLAIQYKEKKSFPWPGAANVKYPLVTTAAMQFSARAYPSLIVGKNPVKGRVIGPENPQLTEISEKIAKHMSYQIMEEMTEWEEEMDKMFIILPIVGMCFKKTYFDTQKNRNVSQLVLPKDLVVNYWAKSLEGDTRKHHILEMTANDVYTRKKRGVFLEDVELGSPNISTIIQTEKNVTSYSTPPQTSDETTPYRIIESHCNMDLDEDGYQEPYIITWDYASAKVLRIVPRFTEKSIEFDDEENIIYIKPDEYFTKYGFIPNPDGSFYDLGFGLLLGPINETVNSSLNQLLDQGTMYTTSGGFLGKGVRIKAGDYRFAPNEWKVINATTDDLKKAIYPLPVREPSQVLFQLLGSLIEGGEKVASIAEIFVGKMPGQNTPATTTMETVKQGMAVFTAIYKRIYRSLDKELKKLFVLNTEYLDDKVDYPVDLTRQDYQMIKITVQPTADPDAATDAEKLVKAQALMSFIPMGTVNPQVVTRRVLEAMRIEKLDEVLMTQPPPNPEQQKMQMEMQIKQADAQMKQEMEKLKLQIKQQEGQMELMMKQMEMQMREKELRMDLAFKEKEIQMEGVALQQEMALEERQHQQTMQQNDQQHRQKVELNEESHKQKMTQTKEAAKVKKETAPKKTAKPKK